MVGNLHHQCVRRARQVMAVFFRRGPIWRFRRLAYQIKADVLGVPYQRLKGNEFGTWGAAMIAGKAAGLIDNLAAHAEQTAILSGAPCLPSEANHEVYGPIIEKYIALEQMLNQFFQS